ncbi:hypothetical protein MGH68_08250 [Erysipelothrix sp. D19-032]
MKLTKQERSWILYDVANSAFTLIITATLPIYFRAMAESAAWPTILSVRGGELRRQSLYLY